jgi:hypothetical protein
MPRDREAKAGFLRRVGLLAALGGTALAVACGPRFDRVERYRGSVTAAEAELEESLRRFDEASTKTGLAALRGEAGRIVERARAARDAVERLDVPPSLTTTWREELLFLNHVIPAFQGFAAGAGGQADLERLRSILERGRTHQRRGRAARLDPASALRAE